MTRIDLKTIRIVFLPELKKKKKQKKKNRKIIVKLRKNETKQNN